MKQTLVEQGITESKRAATLRDLNIQRSEQKLESKGRALKCVASWEKKPLS